MESSQRNGDVTREQLTAGSPELPSVRLNGRQDDPAQWTASGDSRCSPATRVVSKAHSCPSGQKTWTKDLSLGTFNSQKAPISSLAVPNSRKCPDSFSTQGKTWEVPKSLQSFISLVLPRLMTSDLQELLPNCLGLHKVPICPSTYQEPA